MRPIPSRPTRRQFIGAVASAAAFAVIPGHCVARSGTFDEVLGYLQTARLDFLSIHRPRDAKGATDGVEATR